MKGNGQNNPWLDILLVDEEGHELKLAEPSFEFPTGKIELEYKGNKYILTLSLSMQLQLEEKKPHI